MDKVTPPSRTKSIIDSMKNRVAKKTLKEVRDTPAFKTEAELAQSAIKHINQLHTEGKTNSVWTKLVRAYGSNPLAFVEDVLGIEDVDPWQKEVLEAFRKGERSIAICAGHGIGKSALAAWIALFHMMMRFPQKTILTAVSEAQLMEAMFGEVKKLCRKLPAEIIGLFEIGAEKIYMKARPEESFISARTASNPQAMAGIHCEDGSVLIIADEASEIQEGTYEAATGSMSGAESHMMLISNPTKLSGFFHTVITRLSKFQENPPPDAWYTMQISCIDVPRAIHHIQKVINVWGIDSNAYRIRVLGQFPDREDAIFMNRGLIESAVGRDIKEDPFAPLIYGLDVARFGDDKTVLMKRKGNIIYPSMWWIGLDLMQTVAKVIEEIEKDQFLGRTVDEICVDVIGPGAGVADRLRELGHPVVDVNVAEATAMNTMASKLRDDLWMQTRDFFMTLAVSMPDDQLLIEDLCAPTYNFSGTGKTVIEPKPLTKRRLKRSPDHADALIHTFAGRAALIGGRTAAWGRSSKPLRRNVPGIVRQALGQVRRWLRGWRLNTAFDISLRFSLHG